MKRPKADWVASLIAVTLLIFAAGAALDRSRLVRAASISSNLGRTTTATSLGTNLGRRHLELDVLVGVVTGTHGDGHRPQPGTTPPTDATPIPNLARTLTPAQPRTGVAALATAPAPLQLQQQAGAVQHQAGAGAEATRSPPFLLQQEQQEQIALLKARLDALQLAPVPRTLTATQPRTGVVPLLGSGTPRPGATPDTGTTGVSTGTTKGVEGTTGVAPGRGVTDTDITPNLATISIPPADLGVTSPWTSPAISPHLATSPPEVCVVNHLCYSEPNLNPNPGPNPNPNPNPNQVFVVTFADKPSHYLDALAATAMHFNRGRPLYVLGLTLVVRVGVGVSLP